MGHFYRPDILEVMNLIVIFSLLFCEHGYLSYYLCHQSEIFPVCS